jgi:hypothetical protein
MFISLNPIGVSRVIQVISGTYPGSGFDAQGAHLDGYRFSAGVTHDYKCLLLIPKRFFAIFINLSLIKVKYG